MKTRADRWELYECPGECAAHLIAFDARSNVLAEITLSSGNAQFLIRKLQDIMYRREAMKDDQL